MIATQEPFAPKARREFFFKNSIPKRRKNLYVKLHFSLLNFQFFGFGQNFRKMAARNLILGARAAVYGGGRKDGRSRKFGKMAARNLILGAWPAG